MAHNCVEYDGHIGNAGYGLDYDPVTKKTVLAHRYAYRLAKGKIPEGFVISHTCNNKRCVNPEHLVASTQSDNVKKAYDDGLQVNPHRKLTPEQVLSIYHSSLPQRQLGKIYNVSQRAVLFIKQGKTYKTITGV